MLFPSTKPRVDRSQRRNPRATTKVAKEKMEKAKKEQENMVEQAAGQGRKYMEKWVGSTKQCPSRTFFEMREPKSLSFSVTTVATDKPFNMVSVFFHSLKTFPFLSGTFSSPELLPGCWFDVSPFGDSSMS